MSTTYEQWDIVSGVGITAVAVAACRALETKRGGLIRDPYAETLVTAANPPMPLPESGDEELDGLWDEMSTYMSLRSRFFDDFFGHVCTDGGWHSAGAKQAVLLASGLDTRAFRLSWPEGFRVFEIDQPKVLEFKDTVLNRLNARPSCDRHAVPVDLRDNWGSALEETGFDPGLPTAWLAEGLLPYLPAEAEARLLTTIHSLSAPGSHVAIEAVSGERDALLTNPNFQMASQRWGIDMSSLVSHEDRADPADQLTRYGWKVRTQPVSELAARFHRELTGFSAKTADFAVLLAADLRG